MFLFYFILRTINVDEDSKTTSYAAETPPATTTLPVIVVSASPATIVAVWAAPSKLII